MKVKFNKILNILLLIIFVITISSCNLDFNQNTEENTENQTTNPDNKTEEPDLTIGQQIINEYLALKNGETTKHTVWSFTGTVLDMSATEFNTTYNNYNVKMIIEVDGVKIGIYNGQVDGAFPTDITGLEIGVKVDVVGEIKEEYSMSSGIYYTDIEFSYPNISWDKGDINEPTPDDPTQNEPTPDNPNPDKKADKVNLLMLNDTHGAFSDSTDGYSIGRVVTLLDTLEGKNGDYIKVANGDMLQGSYLSSKTYGYAIIEALNLMEFDAFVIGNHEFDWGLDKIAKYKDGDLTNGEANFPFLGANIFYKGTNRRPDWIDPYTIVDYNGLKVGIVGVVGGTQESSILALNVAEYDFLDDPSTLIKGYVEELRTEKGCDVVVVSSHDHDETLNSKLASYTGDSSVDAIFCAHDHWLVNDSLTRPDGLSIAVVENNDKNETVQEVILNLDSNYKYKNYTQKYYRMSSYKVSSKFNDLLAKYNDLIVESDAKLGYSSSSFSKADLGGFAAKAMVNNTYVNGYGSVNVGVLNTGGVRATISAGNISVADVFNTFPFENMVVLVKMKGKDIKKLTEGSYNYTYTNTTLKDSEVYVVAVVDYVYYGKPYLFTNEISHIATDILMRDLLINYIRDNYSK